VDERGPEGQPTPSLAGRDATDAFFSLHRYEVLEKPQYQRLRIGTIIGEQSRLHGRIPGSISSVPYAEPNWLSPAYHSAYYNEVRLPNEFACRTSDVDWTSQSHRQFQKAVRQFFDDYIYQESEVRAVSLTACLEAQLRLFALLVARSRWKATLSGCFRQDGVRPYRFLIVHRVLNTWLLSETNIHAMRLGPGKHLQGRTLLGGAFKPEEFDYFHEVLTPSPTFHLR
jgi:hypothetical protein